MRPALKEQLANDIANQPNHPYVGWYAQQVASGGASSEAIALLESCLAQNPKHEDALLVYGMLKVDENELEVAKEKLLELISIEPRCFEGLNTLMTISLKQGAISRARELYGLMTSIDPWFKTEIPDLNEAEALSDSGSDTPDPSPQVESELEQLGVSEEEENLLDIDGSDIDAAIDGLFDEDDSAGANQEPEDDLLNTLFEEDAPKKGIVEVNITGDNLGDVLDGVGVEESEVESDDSSEDWVQPVSGDELESSLDDLFGDFDLEENENVASSEDLSAKPEEVTELNNEESNTVESSDVEDALDSLFGLDEESNLEIDIEESSDSSSEELSLAGSETDESFDDIFASTSDEEETVELKSAEGTQAGDDIFGASTEEPDLDLKMTETSDEGDDIFGASSEESDLDLKLTETSDEADDIFGASSEDSDLDLNLTETSDKADDIFGASTEDSDLDLNLTETSDEADDIFGASTEESDLDLNLTETSDEADDVFGASTEGEIENSLSDSAEELEASTSKESEEADEIFGESEEFEKLEAIPSKEKEEADEMFAEPSEFEKIDVEASKENDEASEIFGTSTESEELEEKPAESFVASEGLSQTASERMEKKLNTSTPKPGLDLVENAAGTQKDLELTPDEPTQAKKETPLPDDDDSDGLLSQMFEDESTKKKPAKSLSTESPKEKSPEKDEDLDVMLATLAEESQELEADKGDEVSAKQETKEEGVTKTNGVLDDVLATLAEESQELESPQAKLESDEKEDSVPTANDLDNALDSLFDSEEEEHVEEVDDKASRPVSTTLAEIYFNQQAYAKALGIYETLFESDSTNESIKERIEEIKTKMAESAEEQ
jgi:hypothetical protein